MFVSFNSNTTGTTSGAETSYPFWADGFTPRFFFLCSYCSIFSFLWSVFFLDQCLCFFLSVIVFFIFLDLPLLDTPFVFLFRFTASGYLFRIFLNSRLPVTYFISSPIYDFWLPLLYLPQFTNSGYLFRIFFEIRLPVTSFISSSSYDFWLPLSYLPQFTISGYLFHISFDLFTTSVYHFGIFKHCCMNYTKTPKGPSW
jgi:hypothetical protein